MTTGMDWIGRRIDQISSESRNLGRMEERADIAKYLNDFATGFERTPVLNVRLMVAELAQEILDGKHLEKPAEVKE